MLGDDCGTCGCKSGERPGDGDLDGAGICMVWSDQAFPFDLEDRSRWYLASMSCQSFLRPIDSSMSVSSSTATLRCVDRLASDLRIMSALCKSSRSRRSDALICRLLLNS